MELSDLFTSAGINIAFAALFLLLFSVFSKRPSNAGVYFAKDLAEDRREEVPHKERRTLESFIPSVGWLVRAWSETEEDILKRSGLDAVVVLRVFIFSIRLFAICSVIGLGVLVPTTFTVTHADEEDETEEWAHTDFNKFSISNMINGSSRYWVHFGVVYFISFCTYVMLYMEYRNITMKRLTYLFQARPRPDQFSVLVRAIPKDTERSYSDLVQDFFSKFHASTYLSHQMVYDASKVQGMIVKLNNLKAEIDCLRQKPAQEREPRRQGCCGLWGPKLDPIEGKTIKLEELYQKIRDGQREILNNNKEIPAAVVSFNSRFGAAMAAESQQAENPLTWVTQWAPEPRDVDWPNLWVSSINISLRRMVAAVVVFFITIFYCVPSAAIQIFVNIRKIRDLLPDALKPIVDFPGVEQLIGGYLPSLLLALLLSIIPPIMLFMSRLEGHPSYSTQEQKACKKFFYFLAGPIFFIQVLGGGVVDVATEWEFIKNPTEIPFRLAASIPAQATFFMSYIMTTGWAGFPLEILNFSTLTINLLERHTLKEDSGLPELELRSFPYYKIIPNVLLFIFVGLVYTAIAPLLTPFLLVYFTLGYVILKNQLVHVYEPAYETAGQYWPVIHNRIVAGLFIMQITWVGIFEANMSTEVSLLALPLPLITFVFHQYCLQRFNPVFIEFSVESAKKMDLEDEHRGVKDELLNSIPGAYLHPGLKPVDISNYGNPQVERLLPSGSLP